jgi:hypothetical protein
MKICAFVLALLAPLAAHAAPCAPWPTVDLPAVVADGAGHFRLLSAGPLTGSEYVIAAAQTVTISPFTSTSYGSDQAYPWARIEAELRAGQALGLVSYAYNELYVHTGRIDLGQVVEAAYEMVTPMRPGVPSGQFETLTRTYSSGTVTFTAPTYTEPRWYTQYSIFDIPGGNAGLLVWMTDKGFLLGWRDASVSGLTYTSTDTFNHYSGLGLAPEVTGALYQTLTRAAGGSACTL